MRSAAAVAAVLGLLAAGFPLACSAHDDDGSSGEAADALRSLTAQEIVGSIAYGESKTIAYSDTPLYRALSFSAEAGDEIKIDVAGAAGADARAWLLRSTFGTVASNDDASAATRDASIAATITKTGTYYIAVREKNREDASFDVRLTKTGPTTAPDAGPPPSPPSPPGADDHPALPPGPVSMVLEGYGRGENAGRGVSIHMKCTLAGTNPGPIDVSCVVRAPYEGLAFSAAGK